MKNLSDQEWRARLSPEKYAALRQGATEPPFSGRFLHNTETGTYACAGCGAMLFASGAKFDSGSGWPSFFQPISDKAIVMRSDTSYGMVRTEILCAHCHGHLGHVFSDGPNPTGQRYCVNSLCLNFEKE